MNESAKDSSYSHILKYTALFGGVQGLNILVGIVRNKLVAMILGPSGMGLLSLFNSTTKLVSDSTNFGISMSAVKNISLAYDKGDTARMAHEIKVIRSWSLVTAILGMLICILFSPLLDKWTFNWGNHTLHFICLSPVVGLSAITGGEAAILKGLRCLRSLAKVSLYNVILALLITIPIYYFLGESGIVPSLVIIALLQCLLTIGYSWRLYPPRILLSASVLREGRSMIRLGVAFVLAGVLGSGGDFVIRSYLNNIGDLSTVGLFNAGYMMTMTYVGMVFSAMETDYFPRLSGIQKLGTQLNETVNHQMEVSLLLVAPLLVFFIMGLPVLLPLLYSGKFLPVMGMMKATIIAMYFRALSLPMEYIALSRSDSRTYLVLELIYDVMAAVLIIVFYNRYGLTGTGYGLLLAVVVNFFIVLVYTRFKYGFSPSAAIKSYTLVQVPIGVAAVVLGISLTGPVYWVAGASLGLLSLAISLRILHSKAHLWDSITRKFVGRFKP